MWQKDCGKYSVCCFVVGGHFQLFFKVAYHLLVNFVTILDNVNLFNENLFGNLFFPLFYCFKYGHPSKPLEIDGTHTVYIAYDAFFVNFWIMRFFQDFFKKKASGIFIKFVYFYKKVQFLGGSKHFVDCLECL